MQNSRVDSKEVTEASVVCENSDVTEFMVGWFLTSFCLFIKLSSLPVKIDKLIVLLSSVLDSKNGPKKDPKFKKR